MPNWYAGVTIEKDPDEELDYKIDWSTYLSSDTIASTSWSVPAGLTEVSDTNDTTSATIWLSGGTLNTDYVVTNSIVTAAGREADRSFIIEVRAK